MTGLPELLAPAGSLESLKAAVNSGADAVYIGGSKFGARAYADNPEEDSLLAGIRYAHLFGTKVHLTVNTLLKDSEIPELFPYLKPYYEAGLDAVIVQDLGVLDFLHRRFPLLSLHASTQMSVTGPESAGILKSLGVSRIIPARELSLTEIIAIRQKTGLQVETFVHGALCYCYSGQCLMSSLIGGRSGNRGRCAQPCRLEYELQRGGKRISRKEDRFLLNCRDLCSISLIPDLVDAGIDSFKIEGRMKSERYTAGVVSIWRKYLDLYKREGREGFAVSSEDRDLLQLLYDRGGRTEGYFYEQNGPDMMALCGKETLHKAGEPETEKKRERFYDFLDETYVKTEKKIPVAGEAGFLSGVPMKFTVKAAGVTVSAEGPVPEQAKKIPACEENIREKLMKTGGTSFYFSTLKIELSDGLFIPVKELNELRRDVLLKLERALLCAEERKICEITAEAGKQERAEEKPERTEEKPEEIRIENGERKSFHVSAETAEQIRAAESEPEVTEISFPAEMFLPSEWANMTGHIHGKGKKAFLMIPRIFRLKAASFFEKHEKELILASFDGFLIHSLEEAGFLRKKSGSASFQNLFFDFDLYGMNREAENVLYRLGAGRLTLPAELNAKELKELGCSGKELIVAGRLPMMVSAQCLKKNTEGCDHISSIRILKDRTGKEMPVRNACEFCLNTIWNADPLSLIGEKETVEELNPGGIRVLLTTESFEEAKTVLCAAADVFFRGKAAKDPYPSFTRGHLRRGVE